MRTHRRAGPQPSALVVATLVLASFAWAPLTSAQAGGHATSLTGTQRAEAEAHAALEGSNAAVQSAAAALLEVEQLMTGAETDLAVSRGKVAAAQAVVNAAEAGFARAERVRAEAQDQVDDATAVVIASRDRVGATARRAYKQGSLGGLAVVFNAVDPQEALERSELLQSVLRSEDAALQRVTDDRLALAGHKAGLVQEQKAADRARQDADAKQARAETASRDAEQAAARVMALTEQRRQALAVAEANREQDRRDYEQAQRESRELAEQIRAAAEKAAREVAARAAAEQAAAARAAAEAVSRPARRAPGPPAAPAPIVPDRLAAPVDSRLAWPADGRLTSRFGLRTHPIYGDRRLHAGIDIGAAQGVPIRAADNGTVLLSYFSNGYGNLIVLDHGGGLTTAYAHQAARLVRAGDRVQRGQQIGRVGSTGNSTGPHLHFEVRRDGAPVDPLAYTRPS